MTARTTAYYGIGLFLGLFLLWGLLQQPYSTRAFVNTPDGTHAQPVYSTARIGQSFVGSTSTITGFEFFIDPKTSIADGTPLIFNLYNAQSPYIPIRSIATTFGQARRHYYTSATLGFDFKPMYFNQRRLLIATIQAPTLTRTNALWLATQIDSTKYNVGTALMNSRERPGDFGFLINERPMVFVLIWRWLSHPDHIIAWLALGTIGLSLLGLSYLRTLPLSLPTPNLFWRSSWLKLSWRRDLPALAALAFLIGMIYWQALDQFLFQDDLVKLMRVREFNDNPLRLFLTNHRYLPLGNEPNVAVGFYRPLSFSIFPWLLWNTVGLSPAAYHFSSLLIFIGCSWGIYLFSVLCVRSSLMGFLMTLLWSFHSTKIGLLYWWSSTEDLLANFFLIGSLLLYIRFRAFPGYKTLIAVVVVFAAAVFSKEHTVILFAIILLLELMFGKIANFNLLNQFRQGSLMWLKSQRQAWLSWWHQFGRLCLLLLLITGVYLGIRTVAIYDPTLPLTTQEDTSYQISLQLPVLLRNVAVYGAWSMESWLWPKLSPGFIPLVSLEQHLQDQLGHTESKPPYYPALVLGLMYLAALWYYWPRMYSRKLLLLAGAWWVLMLMPNLFLSRSWAERWLTLSTWSVGLVAAVILLNTTLKRPALRSVVVTLLCTGIVGYGYWMARLPEKTQPYTELSLNARQTLQIFAQHQNDLTPESTIYLVGIPHDKKGTINVYLLRLFFTQPFSKVIYAEEPPSDLRPDDVVITYEAIENTAFTSLSKIKKPML